MTEAKPLKVRIYVTLKPTVLDPQGQTIQAALAGLGHAAIRDVRQGKYFEIALAQGVTREQAAGEIEAVARDVLSNPVIEDYRLEFVD
ncbi:MAG: phosphoribosylformylglycinamidine synthase subunit PurS [Acidobacteria bacterium]|nr:phosphoribosylformylglycinamidine synthase subunit PurS [Acidobacteriota bacterium]